MSNHLHVVKEASRHLLRARVIVLGIAAVLAWTAWRHPPVESIGRQEIGIRLNRLSGTTTRLGEGIALALPGIHEIRRYSLQDQTYTPTRSSKADGEAPFQSSEGLSLGVELSIRYALDPAVLASVAGKLPADIGGEVVEPLVQGVIYKVFTRYTVREIFSTKRQELQDVIEAELKPLLAADGVVLRHVTMGNVDLPPDYRAGMDKLLAVELETEQMQYTLQLKEKLVKQSGLEADAEKVRREKAAEASANEQIIAAKAQEEAMKHVIPFKQKQIEQRKLEAEAEKAARIRTAEGNAEARRIEASGEADSRRKLADADAYRTEQLGKVASEQLERDGALISKHPLLIQKTIADKLSDKISVIIAPPPADGGFIGANLIGGAKAQAVAQSADGE
jgi:regulator of protease activity HflC (stomatin/prohibitin superfamily)